MPQALPQASPLAGVEALQLRARVSEAQQAPNQPPYPPHQEQDRVDSESDAGGQDFATADEAFSSEEEFEEVRDRVVEQAEEPSEAPEPTESVNLSQKEVQPRYPLRKRSKRGSDSMEPPVDSAQSPKHLLCDQQAWLTSPRLNFTPDGEPITRITFLPQRADINSTGPAHRATALRTIPRPPRGRGRGRKTNVRGKPEAPVDVSAMDMDECFDYL